MALANQQVMWHQTSSQPRTVVEIEEAVVEPVVVAVAAVVVAEVVVAVAVAAVAGSVAVVLTLVNSSMNKMSL